MRLPLCLLSALLAASAHAQDLADTCRASSQWDLTVAPDRLRFDRAQAAPRRVELHGGRAVTDGVPLRLDTEQSDRLVLFEQDLRALVPKAKAVAREGVRLATEAVRAEVAQLQPSAETRRQIDAMLAARSAELGRRIDATTSTREWQDDVVQRWIGDASAEILPLLAADLGAQALAAAAGGDLGAAAALHERASGLATDLRPRLERRMQALRPRIEALCPSIRRLHELQQGIRGANGRALDLVEIDASR
ncbi:DUF2884 family protein [Dokdonella sp.]|uniref:DUF2884 family protein n=1 Tax=Dokdonella sp. TaxID=2291710 RepID=UPI00262F54FA|nr:DUF2884 family protein [Dokdonella sp.]